MRLERTAEDNPVGDGGVGCHAPHRGRRDPSEDRGRVRASPAGSPSSRRGRPALALATRPAHPPPVAGGSDARSMQRPPGPRRATGETGPRCVPGAMRDARTRIDGRLLVGPSAVSGPPAVRQHARAIHARLKAITNQDGSSIPSGPSAIARPLLERFSTRSTVSAPAPASPTHGFLITPRPANVQMSNKYRFVPAGYEERGSTDAIAGSTNTAPLPPPSRSPRRLLLAASGAHAELRGACCYDHRRHLEFRPTVPGTAAAASRSGPS